MVFAIVQRCYIQSHIFRPITVKNIVIYYMNDLIIRSDNYEKEVEKLKMVLQVPKNYGLEIKEEKCQLFQKAKRKQ